MTDEKEFQKKIEDVVDYQNQMIQKYGWYSYGVIPNQDVNEHYDYMNIRTHFVGNSFNHPNLQIAMFVGPETAQNILHNTVNEIKQGVVFHDGDIVDNIIEGYPVLFKSIIEDVDPEKALLRIVFPDRNRKFPGDKDCTPAYERQVEIDLFKEDVVND